MSTQGKKLNGLVNNNTINNLHSQPHDNTSQIFPNTDSWIFQSIDASAQTQLSLQKKIVKIYQIIQRNTVVNVEKTKNIEILKAQIDAYETIISKIENAQKIKQAQNNEMQQSQTKEHQNFNFLSTEGSSYTHQAFKKQSKPQVDNFDQEDSYQIYKRTKQQKKKHYRFSAECENQQYDPTRNTTSRNSATQLTKTPQGKYNYNSRFKTVCQFLQSNEHQPTRFETHNSQQQSRFQNKIPITLGKQIKRQNTAIQNRKSRRQSIQQRNCVLYSPRDSIDKSTNMNASSKSFLKKGVFQYTSTGNLGNKYSTVDIDHLWNQTQTSKFKEIQNTVTLPKGTAKQYIKLLKTNNTHTSSNSIKNKPKKPINK